MPASLDTIDIEKHVEVYESGSLEKLVLVLNGTPLKGTFDAGELAISLAINREDDLEIMTCSCGNAGCAGINYGTTIIPGDHIIRWEDIDCGLPNKSYRFDRKRYEAVIDKAIRLMKELAVSNGSKSEEEDDDCYGLHRRLRSEEDVDKALAHQLSWHLKQPSRVEWRKKHLPKEQS